MSEPLWKQLELLVADIQRQLAPDAIVEHNVKLRGRDSEQMRQVDVLVRQQVGQYEIMVAIDCKDYAEPVDVEGIEEFCGLVRDIGANKGALVCPKGFTKAAKNVASRNQIDLFSPVDTDPHKWQVKVALPMICDYRAAAIAFGISMTAPVPFMLPGDFSEHGCRYNGLPAFFPWFEQPHVHPVSERFCPRPVRSSRHHLCCGGFIPRLSGLSSRRPVGGCRPVGRSVFAAGKCRFGVHAILGNQST